MKTIIVKNNDLDVKPVSLTEQASRILVDSILQGVLRPGDQLVETELQKQLGISRSPLREAFRDLEKKGLVDIIPRKGTFVKTITRKGITEHYPVQAALEGLAAREAFSRMTRKDYVEMEKEYEAMSGFIEATDAQSYEYHHERFHGVFINACENELLINAINNMRLQGTLYRYFHRHSKKYVQESLKVHRNILNLFKNKKADPEKLEKAVRRHIEVFAYRGGWDL
jgi:DNA-binding GntR family transcriptional regulator